MKATTTKAAAKALAKTLKVRFLEDAVLHDHTGAVEQSYRAGDVHELRVDRAQRWIRRNKAEIWSEAPATPAEPQRAATDPTVDIPANWAALHWKAQAALATRLMGREITKAAEAREIIEAEVKRREVAAKTAAPPAPADPPRAASDDAGMGAAQHAFRQQQLAGDGS